VTYVQCYSYVPVVPSLPAVIEFVLFHRAFMQCRFSVCRVHLSSFVERRNADRDRARAGEAAPAKADSGEGCLPMHPYVANLSERTVQFLIDEIPWRRAELLSALHDAAFSPYHSLLHFSFSIVQKHNLDVDFRAPPQEILQLLISKRMYEETRGWARTAGLNGDSITFQEVGGGD
jgi:hypothetical protein